jgi:tetratricopeptide (TPR) repeat protein
MSEARAHYRKGFRHFAQDELDDAIAAYREAIAEDEALGIAWNGLSMALAKRGDLAAAIEAAERLVALEPDEPLSHTNLSRVLMQAGKIPEAEDAKAAAMRLQMKQQGS